jgi:hypothetical protein
MIMVLSLVEGLRILDSGFRTGARAKHAALLRFTGVAREKKDQRQRRLFQPHTIICFRLASA